jgi:hypothetical protein
VIDYLTPLRAVVAQYLHFPIPHLIRHLGVLYLFIKLPIVETHVTKALEAQRALIPVLRQVLKALTMEGMTALKEHTRLQRGELVMLADGTHLIDRELFALVPLKHLVRDAGSTGAAMGKIFSATDSADPALVAMKLFLAGIKIEISAFQATVTAK